MKPTNEEIVESGLKLLKRNRLEGEIFLLDAKVTRISILSGKVENLEERRERGCAIRVFKNSRIGFSYTADPTMESLDATIRKAHEFSQFSSEDPSNILPLPEPVQPLETYNQALLNVSTDEKIDFACRIEESARSMDPRIEKVKSASYRDFIGEVFITNSAGINLRYRTGRVTGSIELSASDGVSSQLGYYQAFGSTIDDMDAKVIGRTAAVKAIDKLGARDFKTSKLNVVLSNEISSSFFAETSSFFSAKRVLKKKSALMGKLGMQIGSLAVTLIDDGRKKEAFAPCPFDAEGMPSRETVLINNGVLENYLHNYQTSQKMSLPPTSNCVRGSYTISPKIGISNLYIKPSNSTPEEIISSVKSGIYITDILGLHTADTVTGDFSVGASGRYIENGNLSYPVHRIAISGNVLALLASIDAAANDLEFFTWGGGVTLLLRKMTISGT